jgi:hypothetical protein
MEVNDEEVPERQLVDEVKAQILTHKISAIITSGYRQTSSKYRTLNRVPPGKTGLEALKEINPSVYQRIMNQANDWAEREFMALCHDEELTLTVEEFQEYRRQRGLKYHGP